MKKYNTTVEPKSERITRLVDRMFKDMPEVESYRAVLLTESYKQTEDELAVLRRAKAFAHVLENIPVVIREEELIVGSNSTKPRGCQTYPEYSNKWLEAEFDTLATRSADPFYISEESKKALSEAHKYWDGKTVSELALSLMTPETILSIDHNIFTVGNYLYGGVGHVTVNYGEVLAIGYNGIIQKTKDAMAKCDISEKDYPEKCAFYDAVITSCEGVITYANRHAKLAREEAERCQDETRKQELLQIAKNCENVPANGATNFYEACQSFWFVQQLIQIESSGHSISPGRFDQYMYPYYEKDIKEGKITRAFAQELIDSLWVKLNDLTKCRDLGGAEGFAGYGAFQNLIVGGQTPDGVDATNDLSFMCIQASHNVFLPQPSLSMRVWNGTPDDLMVAASGLTKTGIGLPAFYNDEVIIPALMSRGLTLQDARDYNIIGCVEPQKGGKTEGWHDSAFFNMCRPLELVFSNGMDNGVLVGKQTGDMNNFKTFDEFYTAYKTQMDYQISLMINSNNAVDKAHSIRGLNPFQSCMIEDCIGRGKTVQEGGAVYNFTGPQGFGVANMADSLYTVKELVFEQNKITLEQLKKVLELNYGYGVNEEAAKNISPEDKQLCENVKKWIDELPKFGNDLDEVDLLARDVAYVFTKPVEKYKNPRGGTFQAGLYPVSANVPLGGQTGATPDGRLAFTPVADGVSPSAGKDVAGPTAAVNSVSKMDHFIASNGTLFNQKFHPTALDGQSGIENFISLIRVFFERKGSHIQFNVVDRDTLREAQEHPDKYKQLVVRVAGYSAIFVTLSKSLQEDIINRTELTF
ncbi:glycyl radical enzyme [Candidatus Epulonipiscium fishelsonii]|uniref:Glycyl radical enzyme n=1 Tax=Candidatus Epulonipiscium fishelsonii TaxID=77094 RepID=A0ACC8X7A9_9FIRM|nr:glycyl radical enzyme [Epulopiscium sp. SCG-B11WGA-EpuloA1]ONI38329.1 glycyl radical enzyme [Epulopiscium sp. SCG-B05WGA-EpuloA1]